MFYEIIFKAQWLVHVWHLTVGYLGFQKGAKFSLATSAHTKGAQLSFQNFSCGEKKFFANPFLPGTV